MFRGIIFLILILIGAIGLWFTKWKENKLIRLTRGLKDEMTEQRVTEYISVVKQMKIPSKDAVFWGHLREAYEAVSNSQLDETLKQQFRSFLQEKGAKWAR